MKTIESDEHGTRQSTPMGRVWKVVIASMLFTIIAGVIWHITTLEEVRLDNLHEKSDLRLEIEKLTDYRASLLATSTPKITLPQ